MSICEDITTMNGGTGLVVDEGGENDVGNDDAEDNGESVVTTVVGGNGKVVVEGIDDGCEWRLWSAPTQAPILTETDLDAEVTPASKYIKLKGKSFNQSMFYCFLCKSGTGLFIGEDDLIHHFQATCKIFDKTCHKYQDFHEHMISIHEKITSDHLQQLYSQWLSDFIDEISKPPEPAKILNADPKQSNNANKLGGGQATGKVNRKERDVKVATANGHKIGQWIIKMNETTEEIKIGKKPRSNNANFYCEVCNISLTSQIVFDEHTRGKNHKKKLNQSDASQNEVVEGSTKFRCDYCDLNVNSEEVLNMHLQGKNHRKKVNQSTGSNGNPAVKIESGKENKHQPDMAMNNSDFGANNYEKKLNQSAASQNDVVEGSNKFRCDYCDLNVNSEEVLNTHLQGKNHRKKLNQSTGSNGDPAVKNKSIKDHKHQPDIAVNNSDLWADVFTENLSDVFSRKLDMNSKHLDRDTPLKMDRSLTADFVCKNRLRGGGKICGRTWDSTSVTVTFLYKIELARNQGVIQIKEYGQKCQKCSWSKTFAKPTLDYESADETAKKLKLKILEKFYGEDIQNKQDSSHARRERKKPHDTDNCEACSKGVCVSSM